MIRIKTVSYPFLIMFLIQLKKLLSFFIQLPPRKKCSNKETLSKTLIKKTKTKIKRMPRKFSSYAALIIH